MKRRNVFLLSLLCFLFLCPRFLQARSDAKAREILDKTAAAFRQAQAVSITFGGTQEGTLLLKGNKFHLNTGDVETWFDGKTQWSYLRQNEEVNVSTPHPGRTAEHQPVRTAGPLQPALQQPLQRSADTQRQTGTGSHPDSPCVTTGHPQHLLRCQQPL